MSKRHLASLAERERAVLDQRLSSGRAPARELLHARILLKADQGPHGPGWTDPAIAAALDVRRSTVERVRKRFAEGRLAPALTRRLRHRRQPDGRGGRRLMVLALGLRQGEALGLRWTDVDLERGTLRVQKQLQRIDGKLQLTEPKTERSRRTIALPGFALDALRGHRVRQLEERLVAGEQWQDHGLVFPSTNGTPLDPRNMVRQVHELLDRAGLPRKRFHDLRHTCATLLLVQGADLRVVMDVLGHSQISLTANTYQHVVESLKRDAADRMQALFAGRR